MPKREATTNFEDLTQEERELVAGKTPEEILALAKEKGYELSDEELELISGGEAASCRWGDSVGCAKCNTFWRAESAKPALHKCPNCGDEFYC